MDVLILIVMVFQIIKTVVLKKLALKTYRVVQIVMGMVFPIL